jgi:hypothetical protein
LPAERITPSKPFAFVGLDYAGPLHIRISADFSQKIKSKKSLPTTKCWIVLWVCLSTRSLSLDIVADLTGDSFLLAFRRFAARYGNPTKIHSDNAPIYTSFDQLLKSHIMSISWHFRPPSAAWKGGHYEIFVKQIKFHLRRCLTKGIFPHISTFSHLSTLLCEIQTAINSRPITFDSSNPNEERPLRPIDFLRPLGFDQNWSNLLSLSEDTMDPDYAPPSNNHSLLQLWTTMSNSAKKFWQMWQNDYILSLRERHKKLPHPHPSRWPTVGEVVLVFDESTPRTLWPLARILSVQLSQDNFPDIATIKLFPSNHITRRSVYHLFPLEVDHIPPVDPPENEDQADKINLQQIPPVEDRAFQGADFPTATDPPQFLQLRNRKVPKQ